MGWGWKYSFREHRQGNILWGSDVSWCHQQDEKKKPAMRVYSGKGKYTEDIRQERGWLVWRPGIRWEEGSNGMR